MNQKKGGKKFLNGSRLELIAGVIFCLGAYFSFAGAALAVAPDHLVINEIQTDSITGAGGTEDDWVELYNPTNAAINLNGWSIQKTSGTFTSLARKVLAGTIPAGGHFLIVRNDASTNQVLKNAADVLAASSFSLSNDDVVYLVNNNENITGADDPNIIDFVGFGASTIFEGAGAAVNPAEAKSIARAADGQDTNNNSADFSLQNNPFPENLSQAIAEKKILSFSFAGLSPAVIGAIDEIAKTISLSAPAGTDVTSLVATFTLSNGASANIGGLAQVSAVTANDFTNTVTYTVRASDGTTVDYAVTVTVAAGNGIGGTVLLTITKDAEPEQNIGSTGADIVFEVNGAGSAVVYYGLSSGYGSTTAATLLSPNAQTIISLAGLSCNTAYHYSIYAVAGSDSDTTGDASFTTGPCGIALNSLSMTKISARANNKYTDGWEWTFNITVWDMNETNLKMKFNQWTGAGALNAGNNMQFSANSGAVWLDITANNAYPAVGADISGIDNSANNGRQVEIKVRMKVPVGTYAGDYNSSYGILTE
jgi:hypothetical protein